MFLEIKTDNQAYLEGLFLGVKEAHRKEYKKIVFKGKSTKDSTDVKALQPSWNMMCKITWIQQACTCFDKWEFKHVRRSANKIVHWLANQAIIMKTS